MSVYRLEDTAGGATYPLPPGETVIGRGPFLGVSDKRVSRNHAVLEVVADKLRIKPIHVNPCFYQASQKSKFVPLERDEWHWLHPGDCFSLLPDQYSFRVLAEDSSHEATLSNSQALDEDFTDNNDCHSPATDTGMKSKVEEPSCSSSFNASAKCEETKEGKLPKVQSASSSKAHLEQSQSSQRKRVLPNWMLQGDLPIQSLPPPVMKAGKKRRHVTLNTIKEEKLESVTRNKQPKAVKSSNKESMAVKEELEVFPGTSRIGQATAEIKNSDKCISDNEDEEMSIDDHTPELSPQIESDTRNSASGSAATKHKTMPTDIDDLSPSPGSPKTSTQTPKSRRTPCVYAERCYRKNPIHFQECSHPGDSDYHVADSESQDDDRPECPYGTDCYRKNPQHKLEYKHTKPPGRQLRKRPKKRAKRSTADDSDDDGEPNEYDLEDSFIDDEEEEEEDFTDEDSDWMPDSEEKDSEDIKGLLKEANKFVKRKR